MIVPATIPLLLLLLAVVTTQACSPAPTREGPQDEALLGEVVAALDTLVA